MPEAFWYVQFIMTSHYVVQSALEIISEAQVVKFFVIHV